MAGGNTDIKKRKGSPLATKQVFKIKIMAAADELLKLKFEFDTWENTEIRTTIAKLTEFKISQRIL